MIISSSRAEGVVTLVVKTVLCQYSMIFGTGDQETSMHLQFADCSICI